VRGGIACHSLASAANARSVDGDESLPTHASYVGLGAEQFAKRVMYGSILA